MSTHNDNLESSGDSPNGSDFGFTDDEDDDDDEDDGYEYSDSDGEEDYSDTYDDEDNYDEFSGSGDGGRSLVILYTKSPDLKLKSDAHLVIMEVFF